MKKIFTLILSCAFATTISAQNFIKFDATDINGVKALNGVAFRSTFLDILVPENFDVSNVVVDHQVAETDALIGTMPTDFSTPQTVSVQGVTTPKAWTVTFKKVKKTTLPFFLDFSATSPSNTWDENTLGWAGAGIDGGYPAVVRYGNSTVTFLCAFSDSPSSISFKLNAVAGAFANGIFDVLTSADGATWTSEMLFSSANPITTTAEEFTITPNANVRYVKWVYTNRDGRNVNLNNIAITKNANGIGQTENELNDMYVANNELHLANTEIAKVEIYNILGLQVYAASKTSNSVNLSHLAKGVYVAKASSKEGTTGSVKFIIE